MRILSCLLLAALPFAAVACVDEDDGDDLGTIVDGKGDAALIDVSISVPKAASATSPGVRNYTVHSANDFDVTLTYDGDQAAKITVTNLDTNAAVASTKGPRPTVSVSAVTGAEHTFKIRIENYSTTTLKAKLRAVGHGGTHGVSAELLAAARANLDRVTKEIDYTHLQNYGLSGSLTDQFMRALSAEYEAQHPDQYA